MPDLKVLVGSVPVMVTYDIGDDLVDVACLIQQQGYNANPAYGYIHLEDGTIVPSNTKTCQDVVYRFGKYLS